MNTKNKFNRLLVLILVAITFFSAKGVGQINYIEGTVVTTSGDTLNGFIDFQDWSTSPVEIYFKRSRAALETFYTPADILFFEVADHRYISALVDIDQRPLRVSTLDGVSSQSSIKKRAFLRVVVDGSGTTLYTYKDFRIHFFMLTENGIRELISNQYYEVRGNRRVLMLGNETRYRAQLEEAYPVCGDLVTQNLSYKESNLKRFMLECTELMGLESPNYIKVSKKAQVKIGVYGAYANNAVVYRPYSLLFGKDSETIQMEGFRIGVMVKIIPARNLDRGSVNLALERSNYSSSKEGFNNLYDTSFKLWYRYKLNGSISSPFVDAGVSLHSRLRGSSSEKFKEDLAAMAGLYFGLGYQYEMMYITPYFNYSSSRATKASQKNLGVVLGVEF